MAAVFQWKQVDAGFKDITILSNFSLTIEEGEKILLYGPSGSGKSTVLKAALGFVPVLSGEIRCCNIPLEKKTIWSFRKKIAYIPQNPDIGEGPVSSIIETIFSYKCSNGLPSDERIRELFDTFRLPHSYLEKDFNTLSGGEKQRVSLIIALLLQRKIYFLDEITASLDGELKTEVIRYFAALTDTTQCIVSHDPDWKNIHGIRIVELTK